MPLTCQLVPTPSLDVSGIVVRPGPRHLLGNDLETLILFTDGTWRRLLQYRNGANGSVEEAIGEIVVRLTVSGGAACLARCPIYEPSTNCVYFAHGFAVMRLDSRNNVSFVAGSIAQQGHADGQSAAARFWGIDAMAADGKGNIYLTDGKDLRVLEVGEGANKVVTLQGSRPVAGCWIALSYDASADVLIAATGSVVCRIPRVAIIAIPEVITGSWTDTGRVDGGRRMARFKNIRSVLAAANNTLLVTDGTTLRKMDADSGWTQTLIDGLFLPRWLTFLPGGRLAWINVFNKLVVASGASFEASRRTMGLGPQMGWLAVTCAVAALVGRSLAATR